MKQDNPPQTEKRKSLTLKEVSDKEGLYVGIKKDGKPYTVRKDRHRFFFPNEWEKFLKQKPLDLDFIH